VREAVAASPSTPRVALIKPRGITRRDVAAASAGVRDVRLAWSDRYGLFATMVVLPTPEAGVGVGVAAFMAPGAEGFGAIETIAPTGNIVPAFGRDDVPLVVWAAPPDATDPAVIIGEVRAVVRTSARTG
jgi:hypothetical protein